MDVKEAVATAKAHALEMFSDEPLSDLALEEFEEGATGSWLITLSFSRPWNTPKTRAHEALERMGAVSALKRSYKVFTVQPNGAVLSMKDKVRVGAAG